MRRQEEEKKEKVKETAKLFPKCLCGPLYYRDALPSEKGMLYKCQLCDPVAQDPNATGSKGPEDPNKVRSVLNKRPRFFLTCPKYYLLQCFGHVRNHGFLS